MIYFCCGMVRSCSTWQYDIVKEILVSKNLAKPAGFVLKETVNEIVNKKENLIYKVHESMPESIAAAKEGKVKLIYIHRDLRDVAASFMVMFKKSLQGVLDDGFISNAYSDYKAWTLVDGILIQEYHQVINDMPTAVKEIGDYLGIALSEQEIKMLSEKYSLEKQKQVINNMPGSSPKAKFIRTMRRKIANLLYKAIGKNTTKILAKPFGKIGVAHHDKHTGMLSDHINTGEVGSYKKVMNAKEISKIENYLSELKKNDMLKPATTLLENKPLKDIKHEFSIN